METSKVDVEVRQLKKPELKEPPLICGLPGSGYVGKLAVDHLITELKAEKLADVYSSSFPPHVVIKKGGDAELVKNEIYYAKGDGDRGDLLLYTGDSQPTTPEGEYTVGDKVLETAQAFGTRKVFTLAAYITGGFVENPKVFGTSTHPDLNKEFEKHSISAMKEGVISGMNGIMIGLARIRDMKGISLLGETSGYIIDAKASKVVLEALGNLLGIRIDLTALADKAKETEAIMKAAEERREGGQERGAERPADPGRNLGYIS